MKISLVFIFQTTFSKFIVILKDNHIEKSIFISFINRFILPHLLPSGRGHGHSHSCPLYCYCHRQDYRQGCRKSQGRTYKRSPISPSAQHKFQRHRNFSIRRKLRQPDCSHQRWLLPQGYGGYHQWRRLDIKRDFTIHQHIPCSGRYSLG